METWDGNANAATFHLPEWMVSYLPSYFRPHPWGRSAAEFLEGALALTAPRRDTPAFSPNAGSLTSDINEGG